MIYTRTLSLTATRAEQHEAAHELLRAALSASGAEYDLIYGAYGKPMLASGAVQFSLSHCRGLAVCAVEARPCGVDCEPAERQVSLKAAKRFCTPEELELAGENQALLLQLWTLKEAYCKMTGRGLLDLKQAVFVKHGAPALPQGCKAHVERQGSFWIALAVETPAGEEQNGHDRIFYADF